MPRCRTSGPWRDAAPAARSREHGSGSRNQSACARSFRSSPFEQQPAPEQRRNHDPVSFTSTRMHAGDGGRRENGSAETSSSASIDRHIAGMSSCASIDCAKNKRRDAEQRQRGEGRRARRAARQFDRQQKRDQRAQRGDQQHGDPGRRNGIAENLQNSGEVRHHARRMNIGDRRDGNPRASAEKIERRGNELADLIPVERQLQQRAVRQNQECRDQPESQRVRPQPDGRPAARAALPACYCTNPEPARGSRRISPNADSYWLTFCCSTFSSALACCGLT